MLSLNTFGDERFTKQRCDLVDLALKGKSCDWNITALSFPKICSPLTTTINLKQHPHLQDLKFSDLNILEGKQANSHIDVLIGADYYFEILTGEMVRGQGGPTAVNTEFGWVVSGPTKAIDTFSGISIVNLSIERQCSTSVPDSYGTCEDDNELSKSLHRFWEVETIGIKEETATKEQFLQDIQYKPSQGRYEVKLPWKEAHTHKSDGYAMCHKRLRQLQSRLKNDKTLMKEYDDIIREQQRSGIIAPALANEENSHFLPHHGVIRQDKETTKLRVVFDGSAKSGKDDLSVNDCLEKGPNLVPRLFDTVIRFRGYPIGIVSDIEKAFHQVQIAPNDRKMLKFLWFDDINHSHPKIEHYQFIRLPFGLTPSPAILSTTIHHHLAQYEGTEPETVSSLLESLYVDDFAGGAHDDPEAMRIFHTSCDLMSKGGFKLRKWHSNSPRLRDAIAKHEGVTSRREQTTTSSSPLQPIQSGPVRDCYVKVLGINWNTESDELFYDLREVIDYAQSLPSTKRSVLKLSAKVFDPIGLIAPFTINMKMLFQTLCTANVNWDDQLEGETLTRWNLLVKELSSLNEVRVSRCYFHHYNDLSRTHQIHGFCDASEGAFAAVVYLRTEHSNGEVEVNLVASKTRVAPIRRSSLLPRLELLGAYILARLVASILPAITSLRATAQVILWTDSFTTLCWILNNKAWKPYIQNRVKEIRELTSAYEWRHCPGRFNPTDLPSRGCSGMKLAGNVNWWNGPDFLQRHENQWPEDPLPTSKDHDQANVEIVKYAPSITHSLVGISSTSDATIQLDKIIDPTRYSTKAALLRVTASILRFIKRSRKQPSRNSPELHADELKEAAQLWIRSIQSSAFSEEFQCIWRSRSNPLVKQLRLYIAEDNIIRCEGRICNSTLPATAKQPILLPPKHRFTELIIRENHELVHHDGIRETLNSVREKYWVLRGRETVKKFVRRCVICRKCEGKHFTTPREPALPSSRVSDDPPFTNTGIDFAGPLYATTDNGTQKIYICLFTCASTRAIRLELVDNFYQSLHSSKLSDALPHDEVCLLDL